MVHSGVVSYHDEGTDISAVQHDSKRFTRLEVEKQSCIYWRSIPKVGE